MGLHGDDVAGLELESLDRPDSSRVAALARAASARETPSAAHGIQTFCKLLHSHSLPSVNHLASSRVSAAGLESMALSLFSVRENLERVSHLLDAGVRKSRPALTPWPERRK